MSFIVRISYTLYAVFIFTEIVRVQIVEDAVN